MAELPAPGGIQAAKPIEPRKSCREFLSQEGTRRTIQLFGIACAFGVVALAIVAFIGSFVGLPNPRDIVSCLYQVIFGFMMVGAELKVKSLMKWFRFMATYFGLGFFYVFVGVFTMSNGRWYQYLVGAVVMFLGVCYGLMGKFDFDRGVNINQLEAQEREKVIKYQPAHASDGIMATPSVATIPPSAHAAAAAQQHLADPDLPNENHNPFERQTYGRSAYD